MRSWGSDCDHNGPNLFPEALSPPSLVLLSLHCRWLPLPLPPSGVPSAGEFAASGASVSYCNRALEVVKSSCMIHARGNLTRLRSVDAAGGGGCLAASRP